MTEAITTSTQFVRERQQGLSAAVPGDAVLSALKNSAVPILPIGDGHDIIFPVENWYALNQHLKSLHLITLPQAGHGPHQHPELSAGVIASFVHNI